MKTTNLIPPNTEYLELNFVGETATGRGNNQQYVMENLHDGTFRGTESRVGITIGRHRPRSFINPMEKWDEIFQSKVSRGYMVTKTKKMEQKVIEKNTSSINGNEYAPIANASVNEVVTLLLECTTAVLSQNYRIKIDDISDEMIAFGQSILKELSSGYSRMSVAEFNNKLKTLYAAIPRRIDNLSKVLAKRKLDFNDIIADEQELFDVMVNRVRNAHDLDNCSVRPTVLEAFHLDWRDVTEEEQDKVLSMLKGNASQYVKAWRIRNRRTEERFDRFSRNSYRKVMGLIICSMVPGRRISGPLSQTDCLSIRTAEYSVSEVCLETELILPRLPRNPWVIQTAGTGPVETLM